MGEVKFIEREKKKIEESLEKFLPKQISEGWLKNNLENKKYNSDLYQKILDPIWDLLSRGGKRWRPALMLMCYKACGGKNNIDEFISLPEIIHNGTLMVDDIEDSSHKRRGKLCTHLIYGVDFAINTGNLMYFLPLKIIKKSKVREDIKLKLYEVVNEELLKLHFGQGMDISWHKGLVKLVPESEYLLMCSYKTGTLARLSAKVGAILADANDKTIDALGKFAESIGIAFQIQDDILNISNLKWGKDFGDDITEGKRTLMVIHVLNVGSEKDKKRLIEILDSKTRYTEMIKEAVDIIDKYNAKDYAYKKAKYIVLSALEDIESVLPESKEKEELKQFGLFVIERKT